VTDFWLGALIATTIALGIVALSLGAVIAWGVSFASRFADVKLTKSKAGTVVVSAEVRA